MKDLNMSDYLQDDGFPTETSEDQGETLESVLEMLLEHPTDVTLERSTHIKYLFKPLNPPSAKTQEGLSEYFVSLDASRPWILYWILHSLDLLGRSVPDSLVQR